MFISVVAIHLVVFAYSVAQGRNLQNTKFNLWWCVGLLFFMSMMMMSHNMLSIIEIVFEIIFCWYLFLQFCWMCVHFNQITVLSLFVLLPFVICKTKFKVSFVMMCWTFIFHLRDDKISFCWCSVFTTFHYFAFRWNKFLLMLDMKIQDGHR